MGSFLIPERGKAYTADDYNQIGKKFEIADKTYVFVSFPAQSFFRKGTLLNLDKDYSATVQHGVANSCDAIADFDIDCIGGNAVLYGLALFNGYAAQVDFAQKSVSCVYLDASIIGWENGQARTVNTAYAVGAGLLKGATATCVVTLGATADQNYSVHVSEGDMIKTNVLGIYSVVGSVVNGSSIVLVTSAQGVTNDVSYLATVSTAAGSLAKFKKNMKCGSSTYTARQINASAVSAWQPVGLSVNLSSAVLVFTANTSVAGTLFKVGDTFTIAGQTGYSSRIITSINNVYAFTANVSATTETAGLVGVAYNVNSYYAMVTIEGQG